MKQMLQQIAPGVKVFLDLDESVAWRSSVSSPCLRLASALPGCLCRVSVSLSQTMHDRLTPLMRLLSLQSYAPTFIMCACVMRSLGSIEQLEMHVSSSQVLLIFLSASRSHDGNLTSDYFTSQNCLRELRCAAELKLPVVFCLETDPRHGGAPLSVHLEACPPDLRHLLEAATTSKAMIPWVRFTQFQHASLRLVLAAVLPRRTDRVDTLYMPSDIQRRRLCLPNLATVEQPQLAGGKRSHLYVSAANVGASDVASSMATYAAAQGAQLRIVSTQGQWQDADHFLVYLNATTFDNTDSRCDELLAELEAALRQGQYSIILCHEQRETHNACTFDSLIKQTPQRVIQYGLYSSGLATPLYDLETEHGQISLRLMLQQLEDTDQASARSRSFVASLCCPKQETELPVSAPPHWSKRISLRVSMKRLLARSPTWHAHQDATETAEGVPQSLSIRRQGTGSSRSSARQLDSIRLDDDNAGASKTGATHGLLIGQGPNSQKV